MKRARLKLADNQVDALGRRDCYGDFVAVVTAVNRQ
jgi:hypothetical protein